MEARSQKRENSEATGQQGRANGSGGSACPDLMVAPHGGQQRFVPGVTLTPTGWAFVAASGASSATAVAAGVVLLQGLSTLGGGAPAAPPVEMAISRVVPVAGSLTSPLPPASVKPESAAVSAFVPIPAVGPLLAFPAAGPQIPIPAVGGGVFAAATAHVEAVDGHTLLAGALVAGSAEAAPVAGSAIALPAARTTDDVASTLALAAAAGAADGADGGVPVRPDIVVPAPGGVFAAATEVGNGSGLPPLAARGEIAKNPAAFRLLAASTTPTNLPSKPLGGGGAVAPMGIRPRATVAPAAVSIAPAAVTPADLPDIAVTGLVLGDGNNSGVAVIQERGSSHRRFVNVGDSIGAGDRFVVASVDAHGVVLRDTQARSKQNRTFRLGIQSVTLREHLAAQEAAEAADTALATTSPAKPKAAASVFAASTARPAAAYTTEAPAAPAVSQPAPAAVTAPAPAPVTPAAETVTAPAPAKPAEEATAKPTAAKAEEPHFFLTTGKSAVASESDIATVESSRPELSWRLLAPSSQVNSGTAPEVIDFRVLLYEADEAEQKAGGEGKLVTASQPLSETRWTAGGKEGAPLNAGSLYRWQVYARMSDGTLAVSPMAQFRIKGQ